MATRVLIRLNKVWNTAILVIRLLEGQIKSTKDKNGVKRIRVKILPATLNKTCTAAALLALSFVPIEANTASTVEPTLLPKTTAAENSQPTIPV